MNNSSVKIIILLTATIDAKGVIYTAVDDPLVRLDEYRTALRKWLKSEAVSRIIFCENSNYDLYQIRKDISESGNAHKIEVIQFDGQHFNRRFGKGYGEMLTMEYVANNSKWFYDADFILKVSGRYFIKNISKIISSLQLLKGIFVVADIHSNLTSTDSRVFAFNPMFFKEYFLKFQAQINDSGGLAFEWALARAIHRAISDGKRWEMLPVTPSIEGRSGSTGKKYSTNILKVYIKDILRFLMRYGNSRI